MKKLDYVRPVPEQKKVNVFEGIGLDPLYQEMFGALSDDPHNPLSRVSVANSSFSLDPVKGCPLACSYCVVGSNTRDLNLPEEIDTDSLQEKDYKKLFPKKIQKLFSGVELIDALSKHPAFIKNNSVISIGTGSSEAFLGEGADETASIFNYLIDNKLTNPVWIVTKALIPANKLQYRTDLFKRAEEAGIKIVLSITYSGAPKEIEPYQADRFAGAEVLKSSGIHISHHLRPIIRNINDGQEKIYEVLERSVGIADSICIGGLRADPGLVLARKYANSLDLDLLPSKPGEKDMPDHILPIVQRFLEERNIHIPVFERSSQVISYAKGREDYNLYKHRNFDESDESFQLLQMESESGMSASAIPEYVKSVATEIGLDLEFYHEGASIYCTKQLNYQVHRALIHALGHKQVL